MRTRIGLYLRPLDVLFFRDGRPFDPGTRVRSGQLRPQTLAGALRTQLLASAGCDFSALSQAVKAGATIDAALHGQGEEVGMAAAVTFRGPWWSWEGEPVVAAPASLCREGDDGPIRRLDPLGTPLPGWRPREPDMLPLWCRTAAQLKRVSGYLTLEGMRRFLDGETPDADRHLLPENSLFAGDARTGIGLNEETGTAADSYLYSVEFLALAPGAGMYVELDGDADLLSNALSAGATMPLGGEGRRVEVTEIRKTPAPWPRGQGSGAGRLRVLTTPGVFPDGWRPPGKDRIVAAAVANPESVSGWDLARGGPRPNRFTVPAGGTYFLAGADADTDTEIPSALGLPEDTNLGWGCCLEGIWNYA